MKQPVARRAVTYHSPADIAADLAALEAAHRAGKLRQLGNWPPGSVLDHVAIAMARSVDGFGEIPVPLHLRIIGPLVKKMVIARPFKPGIKLTKQAEDIAWRKDIPFEQGLASMREQLPRLTTSPGGRPNPEMNKPHPFFGRMTPDEWARYHLRHTELHLSFLGIGDRA